MAQGFVANANLIESNTGGLDESILNNLGGLGGAAVKNDILLFDGNLKFISFLIATDYTVATNTITVNGSSSEGKVAFSDGTKLSHNGGAYDLTVLNSNGIDKFQLKNSSNVLFSPTGTLRRSDAITRINLANLSFKRLVTNVGSDTGVSGSQGSSDLFNSGSIAAQTDYIAGNIALYYYKKGRVPLTYEATTFNTKATFGGPLRITNDANLNTTLNSSPGLFIVDTGNLSTDPIRAFTDTSNPWTVVGSNLVTTESNAQASTLKLTNTSGVAPVSAGTRIQTTTNLIATEQIGVADYTHKMPVVVNGQQFYLLLKVV
jgi:hypothetical protein